MKVHLLVLGLAAACALPNEDFDGDGWSAAAGDCDDFDPELYPRADDPVGDGVDQDCDGSAELLRVQGSLHACELSPRGAVTCSGSNAFGQLEVPPTGRVIALAAGDYHTCALDELGTVVCWGDDTWGQATPPSDGPYNTIDAGGYWSVGVLVRKERAVCWGRCLDVH